MIWQPGMFFSWWAPKFFGAQAITVLAASTPDREHVIALKPLGQARSRFFR
jgi:hypothetical protein